MAPGLVLFIVFLLVPLGMVVTSSMADWHAQGFSWVGWENYSALMRDRVFWAAARNTVVYAVAALLIQVPFATLVGLLLSERRRGWSLVRTIVFLPIMVSGVAMGFVYTFVYNPRFGLLNGLIANLGLDHQFDWLFDSRTAIFAVAATFVVTIGLYVVIIVTAALAVPDEYYEAAIIDGANRLQLHRHITLPSIKGSLAVCVLLALLYALNFFDAVYVLTGGGPADKTTTLGLYAFRAFRVGAWGYANAIGSIIIVFGFIAILMIRRIFKLGRDG